MVTAYYIKVNLKKERPTSKQARSPIQKGFEFCGIIPKNLRVKLERRKGKNRYQIRVKLNKKITEEEVKTIIHNSLFLFGPKQITIKSFDDKNSTTQKELVGKQEPRKLETPEKNEKNNI